MLKKRPLISMLFLFSLISLALAPSWGLARGRENQPPIVQLTNLSPPAEAFAPGRILVRFQPDVNPQNLNELFIEENLTPLRVLQPLGVHLMAVTPGKEWTTVQRLNQDNRVAYAELDWLFHADRIPNDTYYGSYQWNMRKIGMENAWDLTTGSSSVIVAVLDTGVDLTHPDLVSNITSGYDFANNDADPSDDEGHGTHVAGIVAAAGNNGQGVAGVAWNTQIMPVKVLGSDGSGYSSDIAQGMTWAVDHGADILNLSLGSESSSSTMQDAVNYAANAGALIVASAGNSYNDGNPVTYPAAYNHVLAVGASGDKDERADYSETGYFVDVVAPGGNPSSNYDADPNHWILSTYWRGSGYSYVQIAGTSQAAPHVAGLAALMLALNPSLSSDQVESIIENTAVDLGSPGRDDEFGYGRIDAEAALAQAQPTTPTPTATATFTPAPTATPTPTPTLTPTPTATFTPAPTTTATPTPSPTLAPTTTATPTPSPTPAPTTTATPTPSPTPASTTTATPTPTFTPIPTPTPRNRVVNDHIDQATEDDSTIVVAPNGFALALWTHTDSQGSLILFDHLVSPMSAWGQDAVLENPPGQDAQSAPALALLPGGGALAVWVDARQGNADLYWARKTADGPWSPGGRVHATTTGDQTMPALFVDARGTAHLLWADDRNQPGVPAIFYATLKPGATHWTPEHPVAPTSQRQYSPAIAPDGQGGLMAVWTQVSATQAQPTSVIYWSRKEAGSTTWSQPQPLTETPQANQRHPDIALDGAGVIHAIWEDERLGSPHIFAAQWLPDTEKWSPAQRVDDAPLAARMAHPAIVGAPRAGAYAVWQDDRLGDPDIFFSVLRPWEGHWSPNLRLNEDPAGAEQRAPAIATNLQGDAYVLWTDARHATDDAGLHTDIYFTFLESPIRSRLYLPLTGIAF